MIKKFNEDWHSHLDKNNSTDSTDSTSDKGELNVTAGDSFLSAIGKAQKMALQQNRVIKVNFLPDNITLFVDKYSNPLKLQRDFIKKTEEKRHPKEETKFKVGDRVFLIQDEHRKYSGKISSVDEENKDLYLIKLDGGVMIKAISKYIMLDDSPVPPKKEVKFNTGYEVIGLPSGQIIYMSTKQITYFKEREKIRFIKTWKKPLSGGFIPIKLEKYCFEDKFYKDITDMMDTISW